VRTGAGLGSGLLARIEPRPLMVGGTAAVGFTTTARGATATYLAAHASVLSLVLVTKQCPQAEAVGAEGLVLV